MEVRERGGRNQETGIQVLAWGHGNRKWISEERKNVRTNEEIALGRGAAVAVIGNLQLKTALRPSGWGNAFRCYHERFGNPGCKRQGCHQEPGHGSRADFEDGQ